MTFSVILFDLFVSCLNNFVIKYKRCSCTVGKGWWIEMTADATSGPSNDRQMQSQRLQILGVLSGGIAHDIGNLLVGILGNAGIALLKLPPGNPVRENLQHIETAARRAADLVGQIRAFVAPERHAIEKVRLDELVREMVDLAKACISRETTINCEFARDVPPVVLEPTQMRQVVMNLLINASEAIGRGPGAITVRTGLVSCDSACSGETFLSNDIEEGSYAFVEIRDTGLGMAEEVLSQIFRPFFTTKKQGRGIGLATVKHIMERHRGAVQVDSEPGAGTTFRALIPTDFSR